MPQWKVKLQKNIATSSWRGGEKQAQLLKADELKCVYKNNRRHQDLQQPSPLAPSGDQAAKRGERRHKCWSVSGRILHLGDVLANRFQTKLIAIIYFIFFFKDAILEEIKRQRKWACHIFQMHHFTHSTNIFFILFLGEISPG